MKQENLKKIIIYIFILTIYIFLCLFIFNSIYIYIYLQMFIFSSVIYFLVKSKRLISGKNFLYLYMFYIYVFNMFGTLLYYQLYKDNINNNFIEISNIYFCVLLSIILLVEIFIIIIRKNKYIEKRQNYILNKRPNKFIIFITFMISIFMFLYMFNGVEGIINIFKDYKQIELYRLGFAMKMSGTDWILLKLGFNSVGITIILIYLKKLEGNWRLFFLIFSILILFLSILYGGRFMLFYLILLIILVRDKFHKNITIKQIIIIFSTMIIFSGIFAGIRYYSSYYNSIDKKLIFESTLRQSMGEIGELNEALENIQIGETITVIENEFWNDLLPRPIYKIFKGNKKEYSTSLGTYIQQKVGRPSSMRIGAIGEIYLSFGYLGLLLYVVIWSFIIIVTDFYYSSINYKKAYFGIILILGFPSIYLMGANYFISYLQLIISYYFINRFI